MATGNFLGVCGGGGFGGCAVEAKVTFDQAVSGTVLDRAKHLVVPLRYEADRRPGSSGATGTPNPVDVLLRCVRQVIVQDVRDPVDIETARRDVRGDQEPDPSRAEVVKHAVPLALWQVTVQRLRHVATALHRFCQPVRSDLHSPEDEHAVVIALFLDQLVKRVQLVTFGNVHEVLSNLRRHGPHVAGRLQGADPFRVAQVSLDQPGNERRDRCREQASLAFAGHPFDDLFDRLGKPDVQHFIGLIENRDAEVCQDECVPPEVVLNAPGCPDNYLRPSGEALELAIHSLAAVNREDLDVSFPSEAGQFPGDLTAKFTRRDKDERLDAAEGRINALDDWQSEGRGLAGSGLRLSYHVIAGQEDRDTLGLDRGGFPVSGQPDGGPNRICQFQFAERPVGGHCLGHSGPHRCIATGDMTAGLVVGP